MSCVSQFDRLGELATTNLVDLLRRFGISTALVGNDSPPSARWVMASIGFIGDASSGALTVVAASPFWRSYAKSCGLPDGGSDAILCDSAGELVNMAMGRLRNELLRRGVDARQATPTCAFGDEIVFRNVGNAQSRWSRFETAYGALFVRVDAALDPAFQLGDVDESPDAVVPNEADLLFFE